MRRWRFRHITSALAIAACLTASAFGQTQTGPADREYTVGAIVWQQSSGEHTALCYQSFALAKMLLDRDLGHRRVRQKRAVIVDVDETVLDTSRYDAMLVKERKAYPQDWTEWINRAEFTAVPGAVEFLRYANSRGVRVFYVTNRKLIEKDGTARNLRRLGFPQVTDQSLLVRTDPNSDSKEPRRLDIAARYRLVLLIGDDLNDFSDVFEKSRTPDARIAAAQHSRHQFGARFVVLPNPMYGNWENSVYDYNFNLDEKAKAARRHALLKD